MSFKSPISLNLIECHGSAENAGLVLVLENVEVLEAALAAPALTACVTGDVRAREHRRVISDMTYITFNNNHFTVTGGMVCFLISPPYAAASYVLLQKRKLCHNNNNNDADTTQHKTCTHTDNQQVLAFVFCHNFFI